MASKANCGCGVSCGSDDPVGETGLHRLAFYGGVFAIAVSPIQLLGDVPGGMVLLLCSIAVTVALWPWRR